MREGLEQALARNRRRAVHVVRVLDLVESHILFDLDERHARVEVLLVGDDHHWNSLHVLEVEQVVEFCARELDTFAVRRVDDIEEAFAVFYVEFPNATQLVLASNVPIYTITFKINLKLIHLQLTVNFTNQSFKR